MRFSRTACHHDCMDLDVVRALPMADQMTYLRGRILEAALSMEAVARYLHVRLSGGSTWKRPFTHLNGSKCTTPNVLSTLRDARN